MSTASPSTAASSFHSRPHSPAYHHQSHHTHHPHSTSSTPHLHAHGHHHRPPGSKRSVGSSSSLVASTKGQMKTPEKREKEKDRRRERHAIASSHEEQLKAVDEDRQAGGLGRAGDHVEGDGMDGERIARNGSLPPTPTSASKSESRSRLGHLQPAVPVSPQRSGNGFNTVLPQTPPSPLRPRESTPKALHYSYPTSKSTLSPPTLQDSEETHPESRRLKSDGGKKRNHWEVEPGSASPSPDKHEISRPGAVPDRPRSDPGLMQNATSFSPSPFGSKSDSHLPVPPIPNDCTQQRIKSSPCPYPGQNLPPADHPGHKVFPPPRRMYAYNATTAEEEARRAALVDACEGLSSLCSQWHASEYNKLKFGENGAPMHYCPLTIAAPQHVQSIMHAQAMYEKEVYASEDAFGNDSLVSSTGSDSSFASSQTSQKEGSFSPPADSRLFETVTEPDVPVETEGQALNNAVEESSQSLQRSVDGSWVKDVESSGPSEAEKEKERAVEVQRHNPTNETPLRVMVPQSMAQEEGYEGMAVQSVKKDEIEFKNGQHLEMPKSPDDQTQSRDQKMQTELKQAMEDQIRTNLVTPARSPGAQGQTGQDAKQFKTKTSDTHPINVSLLVPVDTMPMLVNHLATVSSPPDRSQAKPLLFPASDDVWQSVVTANQVGGNAPVPITAIPQPTTQLGIGNLLLSSCPGKKVRLDGPVRGRAAICRNLKLDLVRIKEMGVGCIVCCLDDNELRYLGAPWEEYRAEAVELGLHVMRIPMPEGLTPASLPSFDEHVEKVIRNFTLKGIHVLAHCRAGVGRAGLTACAWAIKMGIAGPLPDLELQLSQLTQEAQDSQAMCENARVMSTVERVICLIRRRRSIKAIETFEQVNFLASYVAWLRRESGLASASEMQ